MKSAKQGHSAYHGGSWRNRKTSHSEECSRKLYWPFGGADSEFNRLQEVLLYSPPKRPLAIRNPERVQHLRPLDWRKLAREIAKLEAVFKKHGVTVRRLDADWFSLPKPNLMFIRDHFFMTPWGAVLGRMASPVRAGEEKWAQKALADSSIPLLGFVRGRGTFEGADALWLSRHMVLVGVGNRTNRQGFLQIKKLLAEFGVKTVAVSLPKSVQHLLGLLQIVDARTALVRSQVVRNPLLKILARQRIRCIDVPESAEVSERQGMNIVTLAPRRIIMPANCPQLRALYKQNGLTVVEEVPFEQGLNAAGGLACATGILSRQLRKT